MAVQNKTKLQVLGLRAEGLSFAKIAKETSLAKQTVVDIVKDNIDSISTLQGVAMEAFLDENRVNHKGRLEQLSVLHSRLREEIERRDLSEVPTDKLINLFLKTSDSLKAEVRIPCIRSTQEQKKDASDRSSWG